MRHPRRLIASLLASTALLFANGAQAAVSSTFDSNSDGWIAIDLAGMGSYRDIIATGSLIYSPTGGKPGGYISASDPSSNSFYFEAPAAYRGNLSSYAGGTLSFDTLVNAPSGSSQWRDDPDIVLIGASSVLVWQAAANPGADWTRVSAMLGVGQGWRVGSLAGGAASASDFQSVLSDVSALRIRGEYINGIVETTALDNVVLAAPVPEPETWAMFAAGLALLGWKKRRASGA